MKKKYKQFLLDWPMPEDDYAWVYEDGELELVVMADLLENQDV